MTEGYGKRELCSKAPNNSGVTIIVIWAPNQIFEKSESRGRDLEREIAPSLLYTTPRRATRLAAILFGLGIESHIREIKEADCR